WQHLTPLRKRVQSGRIPTRHPRRYRPHCTTLEGRCLLSVSLTPSGPTTTPVGAPLTWTATSSGHGTTTVYQFSVGPVAGPFQMVQAFGSSNSFTWNPLQQGSFDARVTVKDSFAATSGESATAAFTAQTRVTGGVPVVSPMANPLVALFSAPPSA